MNPTAVVFPGPVHRRPKNQVLLRQRNRGRHEMKRQALFFSTFTVVMLTLPAFATDDVAAIMEVRWGKNAFNFETVPSGPQPLRNLSRLPNGKANAGQLVGDYRNPILTPEAAAVVKQKGELAVAGKGFPTAYDQCRLGHERSSNFPDDNSGSSAFVGVVDGKRLHE